MYSRSLFDLYFTNKYTWCTVRSVNLSPWISPVFDQQLHCTDVVGENPPFIGWKPRPAYQLEVRFDFRCVNSSVQFFFRMLAFKPKFICSYKNMDIKTSPTNILQRRCIAKSCYKIFSIQYRATTNNCFHCGIIKIVQIPKIFNYRDRK